MILILKKYSKMCTLTALFSLISITLGGSVNYVYGTSFTEESVIVSDYNPHVAFHQKFCTDPDACEEGVRFVMGLDDYSDILTLGPPANTGLETDYSPRYIIQNTPQVGFFMNRNGNIGIGKLPNVTHKLSVGGKIITDSIAVKAPYVPHISFTGTDSGIGGESTWLVGADDHPNIFKIVNTKNIPAGSGSLIRRANQGLSIDREGNVGIGGTLAVKAPYVPHISFTGTDSGIGGESTWLVGADDHPNIFKIVNTKNIPAGSGSLIRRANQGLSIDREGRVGIGGKLTVTDSILVSGGIVTKGGVGIGGKLTVTDSISVSGGIVTNGALSLESMHPRAYFKHSGCSGVGCNRNISYVMGLSDYDNILRIGVTPSTSLPREVAKGMFLSPEGNLSITGKFNAANSIAVKAAYVPHISFTGTDSGTGGKSTWLVGADDHPNIFRIVNTKNIPAGPGSLIRRANQGLSIDREGGVGIGGTLYVNGAICIKGDCRDSWSSTSLSSVSGTGAFIRSNEIASYRGLVVIGGTETRYVAPQVGAHLTVHGSILSTSIISAAKFCLPDTGCLSKWPAGNAEIFTISGSEAVFDDTAVVGGIVVKNGDVRPAASANLAIKNNDNNVPHIYLEEKSTSSGWFIHAYDWKAGDDDNPDEKYDGNLTFVRYHEKTPDKPKIVASFTANGTFRVNGTVAAKKLQTVVEPGDVPDYVFADNYKLASMSELEQVIKKNRHLPGIPDAEEIVEKGLDVGSMQMKLLQKIEELTLHMIAQDKRLAALEKENVILRKNGSRR